MQAKTKKIFCVLLLLVFCSLLFTGIFWGPFSPEQRSRRFVEKNSTAFADLVRNEQPLPSTWDQQTINIWHKEHPMYEFILGHGFGDRQYWGVYYSLDDVPLAFQNTPTPLLPQGQDTWTWHAAGDNHGKTKKIADGWYYFQAAF